MTVSYMDGFDAYETIPFPTIQEAEPTYDAGNKFLREDLVRSFSHLFYDKTPEEVIEKLRKIEEYVKNG